MFIKRPIGGAAAVLQASYQHRQQQRDSKKNHVRWTTIDRKTKISGVNKTRGF